MLVAGCGQSADGEAVTETIRLTEAAHLEAVAAKDVEGVARLYDADAVVVVPESDPIRGQDAIRAYYQTMLADPNVQIEPTAGPSWTASSGDLAVTTYTADFTHTDPATGEKRTVPMNNQTVWYRARGASWTIVSDTNVVLPQEGAAPAL
jgi:uncharacterized protein (TIGR02246 family)